MYLDKPIKTRYLVILHDEDGQLIASHEIDDLKNFYLRTRRRHSNSFMQIIDSKAPEHNNKIYDGHIQNAVHELEELWS